MTDKFPKLTSDIRPQVQEVQKTPNRIKKENKQTKLYPNYRKKILNPEGSQKKYHFTSKGTKMRITFNISETMLRREKSKMLKVLGEKNTTNLNMFDVIVF